MFCFKRIFNLTIRRALLGEGGKNIATASVGKGGFGTFENHRMKMLIEVGKRVSEDMSLLTLSKTIFRNCLCHRSLAFLAKKTYGSKSSTLE